MGILLDVLFAYVQLLFGVYAIAGLAAFYYSGRIAPLLHSAAAAGTVYFSFYFSIWWPLLLGLGLGIWALRGLFPDAKASG